MSATTFWYSSLDREGKYGGMICSNAYLLCFLSTISNTSSICHVPSSCWWSWLSRIPWHLCSVWRPMSFIKSRNKNTSSCKWDLVVLIIAVIYHFFYSHNHPSLDICLMINLFYLILHDHMIKGLIGHQIMFNLRKQRMIRM